MEGVTEKTVLRKGITEGKKTEKCQELTKEGELESDKDGVVCVK